MLDAIVQVAARRIELPASSSPPRRIKLLPMGRIDMRDGRGPYFLRDRAHADRIVAATRQWLGSADMMFDYDHQAVAAAKQDGATAPASGWVKTANLVVEDDGIYADQIDWTPAGAAAIVAREYRYISPLFYAAKSTGDVLQLKNIALVNIGAIDLPAIAASISNSVLSTAEIAACAAIGMSHEDFLAAKGDELAAAYIHGGNDALADQLTAEEIWACEKLNVSHEDFLVAKSEEANA